jgi:hypothetical protein
LCFVEVLNVFVHGGRFLHRLMIQVNTFSHLFSIFFTFPAKSIPPACILLGIYVCHTSDLRPMIPIPLNICPWIRQILWYYSRELAKRSIARSRWDSRPDWKLTPCHRES